MNKDYSNCNCNLAKHHISFLNYLRFLSPVSSPCYLVAEWEQLHFYPENFPEIYENLIKLQTSAKPSDVHQIDLDIDRTFPSQKFFGQDGKQALRRILISISIYDPSVGYVQGMNFLAGSILWHTTEVKTFWVMTILLTKFELRLNYIPGLPGLTKHSRILELILFEQYPSFVCYLNDNRADISVYITEWCFTLFAKVVPITEMGQVLNEFLKNGWIFFYKLVITILLRLKDKLFRLKDPSDILTLIKPSEVYKKGSNFLKGLSLPSEKLTWSKLLEETDEMKLSKQYIEFLISTLRV